MSTLRMMEKRLAGSDAEVAIAEPEATQAMGLFGILGIILLVVGLVILIFTSILIGAILMAAGLVFLLIGIL